MFQPLLSEEFGSVELPVANSPEPAAVVPPTYDAVPLPKDGFNVPVATLVSDVRLLKFHWAMIDGWATTTVKAASTLVTLPLELVMTTE